MTGNLKNFWVFYGSKQGLGFMSDMRHINPTSTIYQGTVITTISNGKLSLDWDVQWNIPAGCKTHRSSESLIRCCWTAGVSRGHVSSLVVLGLGATSNATRRRAATYLFFLIKGFPCFITIKRFTTVKILVCAPRAQPQP